MIHRKYGFNGDYMQYSRTALHICATEGHISLVEALLDRGADIEAVDGVGNKTCVGLICISSSPFK